MVKPARSFEITIRYDSAIMVAGGRSSSSAGAGDHARRNVLRVGTVRATVVGVITKYIAVKTRTGNYSHIAIDGQARTFCGRRVSGRSSMCVLVCEKCARINPKVLEAIKTTGEYVAGAH